MLRKRKLWEGGVMLRTFLVESSTYRDEKEMGKETSNIGGRNKEFCSINDCICDM
jgi:hypothetical protein